MPRSLLAVAQKPCAGGAEIVLVRLLEALSRRGWRTTLATPGPGPLADMARVAGVAVSERRVAVGRMARGSVAGLVGAVQVAALARRAGADAVYLNGRVTQRLVPGAALARIPAVVHVHDVLEAGGASRLWRTRWFWRTVPELLVASEAVADSIAALGVDRARLRVVPAPVAAPSPNPARPDWADGGPIVGYVGRIEEGKGTLDLVRAAPAILKRHPQARIVLLGDDSFGIDPDYAAAVRAAASGPNVRDRVILAGHAPDAHELLRWFDVFAYPSTMPEGGGMGAAEALAAGVPVVATDLGANPEVVSNGETGLLVPPSDPDALARAVLRVLDEGGAMSEAARRRGERFSVDRSADVVEEVLWRVAGESA